MRLSYKTALIAVLFCFSRSAFAEGPQCAFSFVRSVTPTNASRAMRDSAVEMEFIMNRKIISLLTTPDGTIGGVLKANERFPKWFLEKAEKDFPGRDIKKVSWDKLTPDNKIELLESLSASRNQVYPDDITVHGLITRPYLNLKFTEPTEFLGVKYKKGIHYVKVSPTLLSRVEYMGPDCMKDFGGIELHFRGKQSAGKLSNDAWVMLDGLEIPRVSQHEHIVAEVPKTAMAAHPHTQAALMGDYYKRVNLAAEMVGIVEDGHSINTLAYYMTSLEPENLRIVTNHFDELTRGVPPTEDPWVKDAWVGFRGSQYYDEPGLWGLEFRSLHKTANPEKYRQLLDGIQHGMTHEEYGISHEKMAAWLDGYPEGAKVSELIQETAYNQDWENLFQDANASEGLTKKFGGLRGKINKFKFERLAQQNQELKMLVKNWSDDPLLFDQPELLKKIATEQERAVERILAGKLPKSQVMREFLLNSGLYEEVLKSLHINLVRP